MSPGSRGSTSNLGGRQAPMASQKGRAGRAQARGRDWQRHLLILTPGVHPSICPSIHPSIHSTLSRCPCVRGTGGHLGYRVRDAGPSPRPGDPRSGRGQPPAASFPFAASLAGLSFVAGPPRSLRRGLVPAAHAGFAEQSRARSQHLIQFVLPRLKYEMVASQTFKGRERLLKFKF